MGKNGPTISEAKILELINSGVYTVCPKTAEVRSRGKIVRPFPQRVHGGIHWRLTVFGFGGNKKIFRARLVWIAKTRRLIPPGFVVHHANEDSQDDSWENLVCVYREDHLKLHPNGGRNGNSAVEPEEIPF